MNEEKKVCPLSLVDWVNYLASEQNRERFAFYNEELSVLTKLIILLTVLNCLLVANSFIFMTPNIDSNTKGNILLATFVVVILIIISIGYLFLYSLPKLKTRMNKILGNEADIIEDILKGKETDTQKILERYDSIWKKKRNIL